MWVARYSEVELLRFLRVKCGHHFRNVLHFETAGTVQAKQLLVEWNQSKAVPDADASDVGIDTELHAALFQWHIQCRRGFILNTSS